MNNQKSKYKNNKGITLIALIITIVVLLILAVVAIGAVTNDGIINHAKNARTEYGAAQEKENTTLENYLDKINENYPNTENGGDDEQPETPGDSENGESTGGGGTTTEPSITISSSTGSMEAHLGQTITLTAKNQNGEIMNDVVWSVDWPSAAVLSTTTSGVTEVQCNVIRNGNGNSHIFD